MSNSDKKIEGHEYDGISELDNGLPSWWLNGFYLTILFALAYFGYYTLGSGPSLVDEYKKDQEAHEVAMAAKPSAAEMSEEKLTAIFKDPAQVKLGGATFSKQCVSCHRAQGQGGIGPNLTDDHWIHGGKLTQIMKTVAEGVLDKGMPPWKAVLTPEELPAVVAYVKSLKGSNPPGAKAPQGEKVSE